MKKQNVKIWCRFCGENLLNAKEVSCFWNHDTKEIYCSYMHCEELHVQDLTDRDFDRLVKFGANLIHTGNPELSYRPIGEPFTNDDITRFKQFLNTHDYLAAYAA